MHFKFVAAFAALFSIAANLLAAGETNVAASNTPPPIVREFRGVWVATVANIDWPSAPGLSVKEQKEELLHLLNKAKALNLNAIVFQVRPACDALYDSELEPWSEYLTGEAGKAPEPFYDPLEMAVEEAHKRGLELHAWINPYRARHTSAKSEPPARHISKTQPELVVQYGRHLWLDPGKKAVQEHSLNVVMDIVNRYDVDGMHIDDYFYPYKEKNEQGEIIDFPDEESFMQYVAEGGLDTRDDWRRGNVNHFIERCYKAIKTSKPWVKFGISPFGIWQPGHPEPIQGFNAYEEIYCDSRKWLTEGWCDYLSPQLYWKIEATNQSYPVLLGWWVDQNEKGRHIWPGNFTSRVGDQWQAEELANQIKITQDLPGSSGNIHFSMKPLLTNRGGVNDALKPLYAQEALIPGSPWLSKSVPGAPSLKAKKTHEGMRLDWAAADKDKVWQWVLQKRIAGEWVSEVHPADKTARMLKKDDSGAFPDLVALYAVNRYGNTSVPAVVEVQP